jgi:hypothetical protein
MLTIILITVDVVQGWIFYLTIYLPHPCWEFYQLNLWQCVEGIIHEVKIFPALGIFGTPFYFSEIKISTTIICNLLP